MAENIEKVIRELEEKIRLHREGELETKDIKTYTYRTGWEDPPGNAYGLIPPLEIRRFVLTLPRGNLQDLNQILKKSGLAPDNFLLRLCQLVREQEIALMPQRSQWGGYNYSYAPNNELAVIIQGKNGYGDLLEATAKLYSPKEDNDIANFEVGFRSIHWLKRRGWFRKQLIVAEFYEPQKADQLFTDLNNLIP